jgi:hypothetical protein
VKKPKVHTREKSQKYESHDENFVKKQLEFFNFQIMSFRQ